MSKKSLPAVREGSRFDGEDLSPIEDKNTAADHTEENSEISEKEPASQFDWLLKFVGEELCVEMSFDELGTDYL